jgi:hypothetical protein
MNNIAGNGFVASSVPIIFVLIFRFENKQGECNFPVQDDVTKMALRVVTSMNRAVAGYGCVKVTR